MLLPETYAPVLLWVGRSCSGRTPMSSWHHHRPLFYDVVPEAVSASHSSVRKPARVPVSSSLADRATVLSFMAGDRSTAHVAVDGLEVAAAVRAGRSGVDGGREERRGVVRSSIAEPPPPSAQRPDGDARTPCIIHSSPPFPTRTRGRPRPPCRAQ